MGKSVDELKRLLPEYYQKLIDKYGDSGKYFNRTQEEFENLARDPAKGFKSNLKTEVERVAGVELEAKGELPGPIIRDPNPAGGEFIDANGVIWDVKGWYSKYVPKGYNKQKVLEDLTESIVEKGENVIIDTTKLTPEHIQEVKEIVKEVGFDNNVLWWEPK